MAQMCMVIDLKRCVGCNSCVVACKAENGLPPGIFFNRVVELVSGEYPTVKKVFLPVLCNHCQEAPCEKVCPTGATYRREDGIVLVDYEKCAGCRACYVACPYKNRSYLKARSLKVGYFGGSLTPYEQLKYQGFREKVVVKCTFCQHRVDAGLEPACVQTCPAEARVFGDLDDPASEVNKLIRARGVRRLLEDCGTKPMVFYLEG